MDSFIDNLLAVLSDEYNVSGKRVDRPKAFFVGSYHKGQ
jgi:hypothetical protein